MFVVVIVVDAFKYLFPCCESFMWTKININKGIVYGAYVLSKCVQ